jgi:UTP--glucose-1-phosphate uridylyltransferase
MKIGIKKAVIPIAGFGTRMLPLSKSVPKELLPVAGLPVIHHVVSEAVAAGCQQILFISRPGKRSVEQYFQPDKALEKQLAKTNKLHLLEDLIKLSNSVKFQTIDQPNQNGLGDAVYCAREFVGGDHFAILLGDAILHSPEGAVLKQMQEFYSRDGASVVAVEEVSDENVCRYGIVGGGEIETNLYELNQLIEKPKIESAPSNMAIAARYILSPEIFPLLEKTKSGVAGEVQITDAMHELAQKEKMLAFKFSGKRLDIGNPDDFLAANIYLSKLKSKA